MIKAFTVEPPIDLEVLDADETSVKAAATPCMAMLVCHGMGQQVPFETLDAVGKAIAEEHLRGSGAEGSDTAGRSVEVVLRFVRPTDCEQLLPRAELTLKQNGEADRNIHLYEAYWAPLTEGVISYRQTAWHLLKAGFSGFRASLATQFSRWMFSGPKDLPVMRCTTLLLILAFLLCVPLLALPLITGAFFKYASQGYTAISFWSLVAALALIASYYIRRFVVQYMGDVIIYVSSNEVNDFWKIRDEIKKIGLCLAKVVYGALAKEDNKGSTAGEGESAQAPTRRLLYSQVVVIGHSLGSVVAYDTLNAIINQDKLDGGLRKVVERTEAMITLGSPLDKTAFLFRQKAKEAFTRDMLAAAYQPLILNYDNRPPWWINVYCRRDVISGSLEYYDDPPVADSQQERVRNYVDPYKGINPVSAHTGYWKRELGRKVIYLAATGSLNTIDHPSLGLSERQVDIRTVPMPTAQTTGKALATDSS